MAGTAISLPPTEMAQPEKGILAANAEFEARVRESDRCIRQAWGKVSKRSMEIGWEGAFLRLTNAWQLLGFDSERTYRAATEIGRSTWYKMVGLAEHFPHLSKEQFMAMSIENAEQLATASVEVRENAALVTAAATQTAREFEGILMLETSEREKKPLGEVYVTMKWRVKEAQRAVIERGIEDWRYEHGIDDPGYALELMIAEFHERLTLVGFISESIPRLTRAVTQAETIDDLKGLRQLFAEHIQEMGELLKICCGEAESTERLN
jgi:hypothetical protein